MYYVYIFRMPTPLYEAVLRGDHAAVRSLLERGAQVNIGRGPSARRPQTMSPLHCAVANKDLEMVKLLLNNSAQVDNLYREMTPLARAYVIFTQSQSDDIEETMLPIIHELRNRGADADLALRAYVRWCKKFLVEHGLAREALASLPPPGPSSDNVPPVVGSLRFRQRY